MNTARPLSWAVHVVKYVTMADAEVSSAISKNACNANNKRETLVIPNGGGGTATGYC